MSYILVVEDDASIRLLLRVNLERRGFEVKAVENAEDGLICIRDNAPRLMLLDLGLPKMTGMELLAILAQEKHLNEFPVIVISALANENGQNITTTYPQVKAILSKPLSVNKFITQVQNALHDTNKEDM